MEKPKRIVEPFINKWGSTITPGQKVFAITNCTHQTRVDLVEYIGYVERDGKRPHVQVRRRCPWDENKLIISTLNQNRIIPVWKLK